VVAGAFMSVVSEGMSIPWVGYEGQVSTNYIGGEGR
jgi:hypothetical protein